MITAELLGAAGAVRAALGWAETHDGHRLDPQLGALFGFFRFVAIRGRPQPTVAAIRRATVRTPQRFGTAAQRRVATSELTVPGPPALPARLYVPPGAANGTLPLLLYFHGGGFVVGDLGTHDPICRSLAALGDTLVLSVAYRLAPEHPFPAAVEDALRAWDWTCAHAQSLGAAPGRPGIGGDSAGANLATGVAQRRRGEGPGAPRVQFLLYPAVDLAGIMPERIAPGALLDAPLLRWFGAQYIPRDQDPADPRLSPLRAPDLSGLCPAIIVTAGFDPLRDQGFAYVAALRAAGVAVDHVHHPSLAHGFADFAGMVSAARAALEDAARRLSSPPDPVSQPASVPLPVAVPVPVPVPDRAGA